MTSSRMPCFAVLFTAFIAGCAGPVASGGDAGLDGAVVAPPKCVVGGCSGQLCVSSDVDPPVTTCEFRPEYACYESADCAVQADGECGWTPTADLEECLAAAIESAPPVGSDEPPPDPVDPGPTGECVTSGCSGQLCVPSDADPIATTCEWREEYACYQAAECEKQPDGTCGWTPSDELAECLANSGASAE